MEVRVIEANAVGVIIPALADLRIRVFRDFPYLYDGDVDYERNYLRAYETSANAIIVGAFDADDLVGAATGTPLSDHHDEFGEAFANSDFAIPELFYCAESVLLPAYRGRGIGHAFFDERERHARRLGFSASCFCAVMRPDDHPARPVTHTPLDGFWRKRGYVPLPGVKTSFSWKDIGEVEETAKPMQFWLREL